jgi:hypothetical protein
MNTAGVLVEDAVLDAGELNRRTCAPSHSRLENPGPNCSLCAPELWLERSANGRIP